ncbi:BnaA09g41830D [Brassica napus]|uniref:(rape) hypothetical protein n=1 Tax=Brassica napus TaxID=3708 RepID=A0A078I9K4_BRANA|nr:unnamed protein product [Brassica napus]CDY46059.1 BnaA09g41830D [Brassica napus]
MGFGCGLCRVAEGGLHSSFRGVPGQTVLPVFVNKVLWSFQSVKSSMALAFIGLSSFSKVVIFFKVLALRFLSLVVIIKNHPLVLKDMHMAAIFGWSGVLRLRMLIDVSIC